MARGTGDLDNDFGPEDVLSYIFALVHSPTYRARFESRLKADFPRIPTPSNREVFRNLVIFGRALSALQLSESRPQSNLVLEVIGVLPARVEVVTRSASITWIDKAKSVGLNGLSDDVWASEFGGYKVFEKWLKDRKGRMLTEQDVAHLQLIANVLIETNQLMQDIDLSISQCGGWAASFR
jgi:hypothetical protein